MNQLICILLLLPVFSYSQELQRVDSLNTLIESAQSNKDWNSLVDLHFKKGHFYYQEDEDPEALLEFLKVDSIAKQNNIISSATIQSTIFRAKVSRNTFSYDGTENANSLLLEALETAKNANDEECIYMTYKELAYTKELMDEHAEARKYADLAFPYFYEREDLKSVSWLYSVYYIYFYSVDSLDKAEQIHVERLNYFRTKSDSLELANSLRSFADFYIERKNNYSLAFPYLVEAQEIYEKTGNVKSRNYLYLIESLALCHAEKNNYEIAYGFYKQAYNLRKDIVRESNDNLTRRLEAKYQAEKKEQEIELLQSQKELAEQQKVNQRNLLLGGLAFTILIGLSFFFLYRDRQKTNKKLIELDSAKSIFFTNISHEFRTPLTVVLGLIDKSREYFKRRNAEQFDDAVNIVQRNANSLLNLVNQLLDLSKIESKALELHLIQSDIVSYLRNMFAMYDSYASGSNLKLVFSSEAEELIMDFDPDKLQKIFTNLISNSLKFTNSGVIKLSIQQLKVNSNQILEVIVSDTGIGISEEHLPKIFKRYYQVEHEGQPTLVGSGIGMTLIKELVDVMGGDVSIESKLGEGTVVTVQFPITHKAKLVDSIENGAYSVDTPNSLPVLSLDLSEESSMPIVLLIEDNHDVLFYLQNCLGDHYVLILAKDGEEGISKAIEYVPDIIISDVMMPKKTGFEVCETLKQDRRTSHIPIILLTAKAEIQDKISGIKYGADAYLIKPFNVDELLAQIDNLIRSRELLREKFRNIGSDDAIVDTLPTIENEFLTNLNEFVKEELSNPELNVEKVCEQLYMSRTQLHRKIKALTDKSITAYIRSFRLMEALKLIKTTSLNIQQIAYETGFSDASYFHRSFVKEFDKKPTDFRK